VPVATNPIAAGDVLLNGVTIRNTQAVDDQLSTSFAAGSAIAKAAAINDTTEFHGVTAKPLPNEFVSANPIAGGTLDNATNIVINGQVISGFGVAADDATDVLVRSINEVFDRTGVSASLDERGRLVLRAEDGRNIELQVNGADLIGIGGSQVKTAELNLHSEQQYTVTGNNEAYIGFVDNELIGVTSADAVTTVSVETRFEANESLLKIDRALAQITSDRAELGAVTNRMQSTLSNLTAIIEASTASRSRIRDADFAEVTTNLSRDQILSQAGISILSQANAQPQQVLSLLQG
jgi:flagellin